MKYLLTIVLLFALLGACRSSGDRVKSNLKKAMQGYLHTISKPGTTFSILSVSYKEEKSLGGYLCEFQIHVHHDNFDSTGMMGAMIKNDFSKVNRTH
jgi:hypothetical protein